MTPEASTTLVQYGDLSRSGLNVVKPLPSPTVLHSHYSYFNVGSYVLLQGDPSILVASSKRNRY